jgi:hypothetical protein
VNHTIVCLMVNDRLYPFEVFSESEDDSCVCAQVHLAHMAGINRISPTVLNKMTIRGEEN